MNERHGIRIVNMLLTIIYIAGFKVIFDKPEHIFRLQSRDNLLEKDCKYCKTYNDIHKTIYRRKLNGRI